MKWIPRCKHGPFCTGGPMHIPLAPTNAFERWLIKRFPPLTHEQSREVHAAHIRAVAAESEIDDKLIWWLTPRECEVLHDGACRRQWPNYLTRQISSLVGRNGRGRLWVSNEIFGAGDFEIPEAVWNGYAAQLAERRGGIVIRSEDYGHVFEVLGFVTTWDMRPLNLDPEFAEGGDCDG